MSDILNIRVTEEELDLIMLLLEQAGTMEDSNGQPAFELLHDLMEQSGNSDEWEPTDIDGRTFTVAEEDFIDHGLHGALLWPRMHLPPPHTSLPLSLLCL